MLISKQRISRRTVLQGMGATVALPSSRSDAPGARGRSDGRSPASSGSSPSKWSTAPPAARRSASRRTCGRRPRSGRTSISRPACCSPLEPYRQFITIVSHTDVRNAEAFTGPEIGGDHFRSAAVFLTQAHPHQTQGSDLKAGTSIDQLVAQKFGQDTPIPSMQLCIENVDQAGGCFYGYSCAYTDSISWKSPEEPLPMIRDPRLVFDQLFGVGATAEARAARRKKDRSILDWVTESTNRLNKRLGAADKARLDDYLEDVREVERRIQKVEAFNSSGEQREQPTAPIGVPDSYEEHVKLMFDLQAIAFASDITRVFAFKMSRDVSNRVYRDAGVTTGFHIASHHQDRDDRILDFAKINKYHVSLLPYFFDRLKKTTEGDRNLLENVVDHLRIADGQLERAQPQALPAVPGRPRRRRAQGQPAPQGGGRHADGECDARADAEDWHRDRSVRRQHRTVRIERPGAEHDGVAERG